jgi:hypothetical protein
VPEMVVSFVMDIAEAWSEMNRKKKEKSFFKNRNVG